MKGRQSMACVGLSRQSYVFSHWRRDHFMVSFFLGFLPIWSSLPLVSPFNYHCPSAWAISLISAWTQTSNVHDAVYRYLNKISVPSFATNTTRSFDTYHLIYPVLDVPRVQLVVPYLVFYGLVVYYLNEIDYVTKKDELQLRLSGGRLISADCPSFQIVGLPSTSIKYAQRQNETPSCCKRRRCGSVAYLWVGRIVSLKICLWKVCIWFRLGHAISIHHIFCSRLCLPSHSKSQQKLTDFSAEGRMRYGRHPNSSHDMTIPTGGTSGISCQAWTKGKEQDTQTSQRNEV